MEVKGIDGLSIVLLGHVAGQALYAPTSVAVYRPCNYPSLKPTWPPLRLRTPLPPR